MKWKTEYEAGEYITHDGSQSDCGWIVKRYDNYYILREWSKLKKVRDKYYKLTEREAIAYITQQLDHIHPDRLDEVLKNKFKYF